MIICVRNESEGRGRDGRREKSRVCGRGVKRREVEGEEEGGGGEERVKRREGWGREGEEGGVGKRG